MVLGRGAPAPGQVVAAPVASISRPGADELAGVGERGGEPWRPSSTLIRMRSMARAQGAGGGDVPAGSQRLEERHAPRQRQDRMREHPHHVDAHHDVAEGRVAITARSMAARPSGEVATRRPTSAITPMPTTTSTPYLCRN